MLPIQNIRLEHKFSVSQPSVFFVQCGLCFKDYMCLEAFAEFLTFSHFILCTDISDETQLICIQYINVRNSDINGMFCILCVTKYVTFRRFRHIRSVSNGDFSRISGACVFNLITI